jgi:hypothetical protein
VEVEDQQVERPENQETSHHEEVEIIEEAPKGKKATKSSFSPSGLPALELPIRPKTLISRVLLLVAPATANDATARYIKCLEVANAIAKDEEVMDALLQSPTNLAFLGDLLRKLMPGFEPKDLGFKKLRDLARFLVQGSDLAIYAAIGNDKLVVLGQREPSPEGFHRFSDLSEEELPPLAGEHEGLRNRVFAR